LLPLVPITIGGYDAAGVEDVGTVRWFGSPTRRPCDGPSFDERHPPFGDVDALV